MSINTLTKHHTITMATGGPYSQPRILGLAEDHNVTDNQRKNALLIDEHYEEGDVVLVESSESGPLDQTTQAQTRFVKKKIVVFGWDSAEGKQKIWDLGHKVHRLLTIYENLLYADVDDNEVRSKIRKICDETGSTSGIRACCDLNSSIHDKEIWLKAQLLVDIESFAGRGWNYFAMVDPTRNLNAVQTLEKHLKTAKRIFWIAWKGHLGERGVFQSIPNMQAITDFLRNKHFAILLPNNTPLPELEKPKPTLLQRIGGAFSYCFTRCRKKNQETGLPRSLLLNPHPKYWSYRIQLLDQALKALIDSRNEVRQAQQ